MPPLQTQPVQPAQSQFILVAVGVIAVGVVVIAGLLAFPYIKAAIVANTAETIKSNEAFAIGRARTIGSAQWGFLETEHRSGTLQELHAKGRLSSIDEVKHGYRFEIKLSETHDSFQIFATPEKYRSTGIRSFYSTVTWVIQAGDDADLNASEYDPPL